MSAFPKVYQSFTEFEREVLKKLQSLDVHMDAMVDRLMSEEFHSVERRRGPGGARPSEDGILFDEY